MRPISIISLLFISWVVCEDYYELLGIDKSADDRTIRKAFKKLAIQKHPDKNKDDPKAHEEFIKINRAYEVLKDEDLRKKYDTYGEKGLEDGFQGGNNYQSWQFYNDNFGIYDDDQEIVTLNRADFQRLVSDSNELWFINFYSTFCSHCHQLAPAWRQFAAQIDGAIRIGAVNCAEDPELCQSQNVNAYPSLVMYPTGEFFRGSRDVDTLTEFVMQRLRSEVLHLNNENIKALSEDWEPYSGRPWVIDFCFSSEECLSTNNRRKLSAMLENLANVGTINCEEEEELCSKFEHTDTGPQFFPAANVNSDNSLALDTWDAQEIVKKVIGLLPALNTVDEEGLKELLDTDSRPDEAVAVWFVSNNAQAEELPDFKRIPALIVNEIYVFDCSQSAICEEIVDKSKLPQLAVFKTTGGYEIDYHSTKDFRLAATFIRESSESPLFTLNPETYEKAISGEELFIVDYFAPWCPPCLKLLGEYRRLHATLDNEDETLKKLKIGSIDCQRYKEICSNANVNSYPTSVIYVPEGKPNRITGFHHLHSIKEFIENTLHPAVIELSPEEYNERVVQRGESETWLVDFFAPWCGPCQQLAPELQRAARELKEDHDTVFVASVDCQQYGDFCGKTGVRSYPTIRLFPAKTHKQMKGASYDYPNHMWRNSDSIQRWVYAFLPTNVLSIGADFYTTVLDSSEPWVVDFYAPWCGHCVQFAPIYDQIAKILEGKVNFAKVDCDQWPHVCQGAYIQQYPTVRLYEGNKGAGRQQVFGFPITTQNRDSFVNVVRNRLNLKDTVKDEL